MLDARSGLGKTSLLNAGVAERLRAQGHIPLTVRVNDIERGPLQSIYRGIAAASSRQGIEYVPGDTASLWRFFNTAQYWRDDVLLTPVLILDQFEELFTLQTEDERGLFIKQLSYLVRGVRPPEPQAGTIEASRNPARSPPALDDSPPAIHIVLSLREDFPGILDERFRLVPLTRATARRALQEPAKVEDANLTTRPFELDPNTIDQILDFLERRVVPAVRRSANSIEPFQLQLICQRLEEKAAEKQRSEVQPAMKVTLEDLGGERSLRSVLVDFYQEQLLALSRRNRRRVTGRVARAPVNGAGCADTKPPGLSFQ